MNDLLMEHGTELGIQAQRPLALRRGSTSVMALLVSMMLMVLITTTMTLTIVHVQYVHDFSRNVKTLQAADSGIAHGRMVFNRALSAWAIPAATTVDKVEEYTQDALNGDRSGDQDISLVKDSATHVGEVMPRQTETTAGFTEYGGSDGLNVDYGVSVDIEPTGVTLPAAGDITQHHVFHYDYNITSGGQSQIGGSQNRATRLEEGSFDVEVQRPSFSTYGYFTQSMQNQFNQQLVFFDGETYSGPTHVNSAPPEGRAGFYGRPVFNGAFTAVQDTYEESWLGGNANPQFNAGATWGVDQIELPPNAWSQLRAAIGDYSGIDDQTPLTNAQLRAKLGLQVSNDPVPAGVYYKQDVNGTNPGKMLGGIFVQGDATSIRFGVSGSSQIIYITAKDSAGTSHSYVVTDNPSARTCTVTKDGVADGSWNSKLNGMIHVEGKVNALSGDSTLSTADIQSNEQLTVSASGNVTVTNHITYQTDPTANPSARNVLGILSGGGNIYLGKTAPSNLTLHATVMAASSGHGIGAEDLVRNINGYWVYDYAYPNKGFWNLLGGLIENKNQTTGVYYSNGTMTGYKWNFTYDQRFAAGTAPPYFPYVTKFTASMQNKHAVSWGRKYF